MAADKQPTDVRQDEIARAALELVGTMGMKGLSMASIAKKVGIVPSGIYRHFRNKDDVINAILDYLQRELTNNIAKISDMPGTALEQLHLLLLKHVALLSQNKSLPSVIFSTEVYNGKPSRRIKLRGIIKPYLSAVESLIEQGQQAVTILKEMDPKTVAVMFLGLIQPSTILWHLSDGTYDAMLQAKTAWPIFRRAIVPDSILQSKRRHVDEKCI